MYESSPWYEKRSFRTIAHKMSSDDSQKLRGKVLNNEHMAGHSPGSQHTFVQLHAGCGHTSPESLHKVAQPSSTRPPPLWASLKGLQLYKSVCYLIPGVLDTPGF